MEFDKIKSGDLLNYGDHDSIIYVIDKKENEASVLKWDRESDNFWMMWVAREKWDNPSYRYRGAINYISMYKIAFKKELIRLIFTRGVK